MRYNWPGNIRELENVDRARRAAGRRAASSTSSDLQLGEQASASAASGERGLVVQIPPTGIPLEEIERQAIVEALKMSNWVQKDAAELLAISPRVMNYKIKILNIEIPRSRRQWSLNNPSSAAISASRSWAAGSSPGGPFVFRPPVDRLFLPIFGLLLPSAFCLLTCPRMRLPVHVNQVRRRRGGCSAASC